eukprot:8330091-Pyramimonas_sp.AAC.1
MSTFLYEQHLTGVPVQFLRREADSEHMMSGPLLLVPNFFLFCLEIQVSAFAIGMLLARSQ